MTTIGDNYYRRMICVGLAIEFILPIITIGLAVLWFLSTANIVESSALVLVALAFYSIGSMVRTIGVYDAKRYRKDHCGW